MLRPSAKGGGQKGSLYLRLIHDRRVKNLALRGCRIFEREWDKELQKIIYPKNDPKRVRELKRIESAINAELEILDRYVTQLRSRGHYTADDILHLYRGRRDDSRLRGFTEILAIGLESDNRRRTAQAYLASTRALLRYNGGADIPLENINQTLIRGFEKHLRDEGKMPNTIAYYIRNLRAIYNKAIEFEFVVDSKDEKPFAGISTATTKTMKRALPLEDLQALHSLKFYKMFPAGCRGMRQSAYHENLHWSWRYFFFCLFARGMSWVDLVHLRKENVRGGMIRYCRRKTGQQIEISLTHELSAIINSFSSETIDSPYVFPILRNNKTDEELQYESSLRTQNNRLKRLARVAGIEQKISTHVARHSWASVGKDENVPVRVISECLGHTSEETTLIYLSLLNNQVLDEANERVESAVKGYYRTL